MKYEDINYNEVLISGYINNITKLNKYIAFGLTCYTFSNTKSKCFISLVILMILLEVELHHILDMILMELWFGTAKDVKQILSKKMILNICASWK